jgi:hypothetical protein
MSWSVFHKILLLALPFSLILASEGLASDNHNLCLGAPGKPSENVQLPKDDTYHYTTDPVNLQFGPGDVVIDPASELWGFNGWESDLKVWHWEALQNGQWVQYDGYRFFIAVYNYDFQSWVKLGIFNLVGPDGQHHYARFEPGLFDAPENAYYLAMSGATPEANWTAGGSGGIGFEDFLTDDGLFGVNLFENSLKNPSYPHHDGFAEYVSPTTGEPLGETYYWARPLMLSVGSLFYDGQTLPVVGTSWQDRQWRGQSFVKWNWAAIQLNSGETLAAFDIVEKSSGLPVLHSLNIEGRPPLCQEEFLSEVEDWRLEASGEWTSDFSGVTYATDFRLIVPSKGIDLHIVPVHEAQEIESVIGAFPGGGGSWEGAARVEGTYRGRPVKGRAVVEQFNI